MKKCFFAALIFLVLTVSSVTATDIKSRAEGGFISILGDSYEGKSSAYMAIREINGRCYGYLSFNFRGDNDISTARVSIRMRVRKLNCVLKDDILFLSGNTYLSYRINQKHKRVFDGLTRFGYSQWRWVETGKKSFYQGHDNIIILLTSDGLGIYSDNFGIYNMQLYNYRYRE